MLIALLLVPLALQWSCPSHMIIWEVAMSELGESYIDKVLKPIIEDPKEGNKNYSNLFEYACWADDIKTSATEGWHYYDIPYFMNYSKNITLPTTNNVAWCVNTAKSTLEGKSTGYGKSTMLRNLIHMMGDAHQPLHVTSMYSAKFPDGDRGGNSFLIQGGDKELHALWDYCLDKISSYSRPLSASSMDDIKAKAKAFTKEFPRSSMSSELSIKDGFKITENVHPYAASHVYKGIVYNGTVSSEYKEAGYLVCKKMIALGGYRLTDAIKEAVKLSEDVTLTE
jgi:hypothetical protein